MTSLAGQLKRLLDLIATQKVNRLIFLRDGRLTISPTATVTQQRLKDLERSGMQVVRPSAEAYAALNVLRRLWNQAAENDLTIGDSTVSMGQLKGWLAEKTPRPLQELIDACQETAAPSLADLSDKLLEILTGHWVMTVEEVAKKLTMNEADFARFATETTDVVGVLAGPPTILFLNPEAVSRT
jgi:hypothetical protein